MITAQVEAAIKREEAQFERLHFALQKARSDGARMRVMQQLMDGRQDRPLQ